QSNTTDKSYQAGRPPRWPSPVWFRLDDADQGAILFGRCSPPKRRDRAEIDAGGNYEDFTALHEAACLGRDAIAQILIEHRADVHKTDVYGQTPLHRAAG